MYAVITCEVMAMSLTPLQFYPLNIATVHRDSM